jgi:U3 small nucleolar RNA-associated protein 10
MLYLCYMQIGSGGNAMINDLFLFFVTSPGKNIFQKHLQYLIINCTGAPFQFISKYFLDEGLLHLFTA